MYSPGTLNVAVVVAVPRNAVCGGPSKSAFSTTGLSCEKLTVPGPRNIVQKTVTGGVFGAVEPGTT
jgi:hypothetical protein